MRAVVDPGGQTVSANDRLYLTQAVPSLLMWGDQDDIIPVDTPTRLTPGCRGSRLEIFEGAGHFLHVEAPERFVSVLTDFIETTEPATPDFEEFRELVRTGAHRAEAPAAAEPTPSPAVVIA